MTSRDRLLRTLRHEITDRVPISTYELCPFNSQSFENCEPSYAPLMQKIRCSCDGITMWNPADNC